jgi:hypothetical protein
LFVPERFSSGASGVPTPAATWRETTNPEGADGQNTAHHARPPATARVDE